MNSDQLNLSSSPMSGQSWIVDNIRSLISNQDDDNDNTSTISAEVNDCTLTSGKEDEKLKANLSNVNGKLVGNDKNNNKSLSNSNKYNLNESNSFNSLAQFKKTQLIGESSAQKNSYNHFNMLDTMNYDSNCDYEIEKTRTFKGCDSSDELIADRIPKRPFSPEEIHELTPEQQFQIHNHNNFINLNNSISFPSISTNLIDSNLINSTNYTINHQLPSSSDYFSDLNLDEGDTSNNNLFGTISDPLSREQQYKQQKSADTSFKKKKLTNFTSGSSLNVPRVSITRPDVNEQNSKNLMNPIQMAFLGNNQSANSSTLNNNEINYEDYLKFSASQHHSLQKPSSLMPSFNRSCLNSLNNNIETFSPGSSFLMANQFPINNPNSAQNLLNFSSNNSSILAQNQFLTNTSTPSSKLFNNNNNNNNNNNRQNEIEQRISYAKKWESNYGEYANNSISNSSSGIDTNYYSQDQENNSLYELRSSFYNNSNLVNNNNNNNNDNNGKNNNNNNISIKKQQQKNQQLRSINEQQIQHAQNQLAYSSYLNDLNPQYELNNCLNEASFSKANQLSNRFLTNSTSCGQFKKITKSSTTLFKENYNSNHQYFTHSNSYDNISKSTNVDLRYPNYSFNNDNNNSKQFRDIKNSLNLDDYSDGSHLMSYSNHKWTNNFGSSNNNNNLKSNNYLLSQSQTQPQSQQQQLQQQHQHQLQQQQLNTPNNSILNCSQNSNKDSIILHVRNLDYKISADEWKRILLENFRKHCKEILSVNVVTNADKSLLGIVKLATKEDARLAISCLHHKKIGYKRLNVNIAFSSASNSPKSKIVALLKSNELSEMALTKFMEMYESRYNQSITVSELFKLRDIVHITHGKDGQGRLIKLTGRNYQVNLENEMQDLLHTPYCSLHSQKPDLNNKDLNGQNSGSCWLPNVIVSLRSFKSAVHKLLNDHGGQMSLLSFMDCYRCCIYNENSSSNNHRNQNSNSSALSQANTAGDNYNSEPDMSYELIIDNENGISLEHLITCAQDVQIQYNEGFYKQLQWENDKSKPINLQSRCSMNRRQSLEMGTSRLSSDQYDLFGNEFDDPVEESQRKLNQFSHEVVELFKGIARCIIPLSKFNNEYHKKYGRQCRVADYGYTKLYELLESIPHILQILGSEYDKKLTLTHRVQVRRFSNDLIKVLKTHSTRQMFADEYPASYEKHFSKSFDIRDYGVCFLEDMLAELPEAIICRKEIEGRTFIQIPKIIQMEEERLCMSKLETDIIDMLKHKPRFSIQFNKFIPNFHHHFGRQCKLSNYGFTKLIELLEAMPDTVQVFVKDGLQFVQLKQNIMLDLICHNLVKYLEENNSKLKFSLFKLEEIYNSKYEPIFYEDFDCESFSQLICKLPLSRHFISIKLSNPNTLTSNDQILAKDTNEKSNSELKIPENGNEVEIIIEVETLNEREVKKVAKLMLKKLFDDYDETLLTIINEHKSQNKQFTFNDFYKLQFSTNSDLANFSKTLNNRSFNFLKKVLSDFFLTNNDETDESITGLSELYGFARQIKNIFKTSNFLDVTFPELENLYKQTYKIVTSQSSNQFQSQSVSMQQQQQQQQQTQQQQQSGSVFPFKRLGYIDSNLLFTQGLNLLVTVKKFSDKRICLNREFWPKSFLDATPTGINDSFNTPLSPTNGRLNNRSPYVNSSSASLTPLSQRLSQSSSSSSSSNFSRRRMQISNSSVSFSTNDSSLSNNKPINNGNKNQTISNPNDDLSENN